MRSGGVESVEILNPPGREVIVLLSAWRFLPSKTGGQRSAVYSDGGGGVWKMVILESESHPVLNPVSGIVVPSSQPHSFLPTDPTIAWSSSPGARPGGAAVARCGRPAPVVCPPDQPFTHTHTHTLLGQETIGATVADASHAHGLTCVCDADIHTGTGVHVCMSVSVMVHVETDTDTA